MSNSEAQKSAGQLIRYGLVGIATNLIGYFVYLLITYWGGEPKVTMTLLYIVGTSIGFYGNRQWTFAHEGAILNSGVRYFAAHLIGYLINLTILIMFVDKLGYPHQWVQAAAIFVVAGLLFVIFKYFVFSKAESRLRGRE